MITQRWLNKIKAEPDVSGVTLSLVAEIERLQAEVAAYHDYISGKITLGQLEAALNRIEPLYQQKPVEEWQ